MLMEFCQAYAYYAQPVLIVCCYNRKSSLFILYLNRHRFLLLRCILCTMAMAIMSAMTAASIILPVVEGRYAVLRWTVRPHTAHVPSSIPSCSFVASATVVHYATT